jgi:hypothetical protein
VSHALSNSPRYSSVKRDRPQRARKWSKSMLCGGV